MGYLNPFRIPQRQTERNKKHPFKRPPQRTEPSFSIAHCLLDMFLKSFIPGDALGYPQPQVSNYMNCVNQGQNPMNLAIWNPVNKLTGIS